MSATDKKDLSAEQRHDIAWFRQAAPYIQAHRGQTIVIQIDGEALHSETLPEIVHDLALLDTLGVRLVLVQGARPQIEQRLSEAGIPIRYEDGLRVTDTQSLPAVKEAVGAVRLEIEALLSMGLANSPMAGARISVTSGNFVIARPVGVRDGIDFSHTGVVRRVDAAAIRQQHDLGAIVLLSPLGYSPTGEVFNLRSEEVATAIAIELHAAKLIFLKADAGIRDTDGRLVHEMTLEQAKALDAERRHQPAGAATDTTLTSAIHACRNGVSRAHFIDLEIVGGLLLELFTRDGAGTMINADAYDATRAATVDDVGGILELIEPLERAGTLVRRSRERLETDIACFQVMERDGTIIACAACFPFAEQATAELACLGVHADYRDGRRGDAMLEAAEVQARAGGAGQLFVLTTQATHWFIERGFFACDLDALPVERRALYNYERNSRVLIKGL